MTDITVVDQHFTFPFKLHQYQLDSVREGAQLPAALLRHKVGEGKTPMSLYLGLYHSIVNGVEQILILAPPALLDQWAQFIEQIRGIDGYLIFRGSPAERRKMDLLAEPVVLMSYNIFRSDYTRVDLWARKRKLFIIGDELSLKSSNQTFKKVKTLVYRALRIIPDRDKPFHYICALNATPVSDRKQVYWWCSIFYPDAYPSLRYFELRHAKEKDHWGNVVEWERTDEMDQNFDHFSVLSDNANIELPDSVFTEVPYQLDSKHMKLYKDIKDAEFAMLTDDATMLAIESLFSTLQRVVLCPQEYGLKMRSPILEIIDQYLDQLHEDARVLIYTRHVAVSKMLVQAYPQAVSYFGAVTDKHKKESLRRFKSGEAEIMIANLDSLSKGQNLQIANHTIFTELPFRSDSMTQACGRTLRQGQTKTCFFQIPLALKTIQTQIYKRLLQNDEDLQKFNRNKKALREFIEG